MAFRYDTQHLSGQQRAIINERDRNDKLLKKSSQENLIKNEYTLSEEQLNFLTRLKIDGSQHYDIFGDRVGDVEAERLLQEMKKEGFIIYEDGNTVITKKGLEQVKDRDDYWR